MSGDWLVPFAAFDNRRGDELLRHGSLRMKLVSPARPNVQAPHALDEIYIVVRGSGRFWKAGEERPFGTGDCIFVEAGVEHHFAEASDDLLVWIIFWGPE